MDKQSVASGTHLKFYLTKFISILLLSSCYLVRPLHSVLDMMSSTHLSVYDSIILDLLNVTLQRDTSRHSFSSIADRFCFSFKLIVTSYQALTPPVDLVEGVFDCREV